MFRNRAKVDSSAISWETSRGKDRIAYYRKMLKNADEDPKRDERLRACECILCFYEKSRIGGAACTQTQCAFCDKVLYSGNTNIDRMCPECAKATGLCKHCGADIDYKNRRKRELPTPTPTMERP